VKQMNTITHQTIGIQIGRLRSGLGKQSNDDPKDTELQEDECSTTRLRRAAPPQRKHAVTKILTAGDASTSTPTTRPPDLPRL
jgi:hypothetical protein